MSHRVLESEHASQFLTNQSIVADFGRVLCLQALICRKVHFKRLTKFQVNKGLIGLQDLPELIGSFYAYMCRMSSLCCRTCDD